MPKLTMASPSLPPCPRGISIDNFEVEGRGLKSTQRFSKGFKVVEEDEPFCFVVSEEYHKQRCAFCFAASDALILPWRCSRCKFNHYCNEECQTSDWEVHKMECYHLAAISDAFKMTAVHFGTRLLLRLIRKKRLFKKDGITWPVGFLQMIQNNPNSEEQLRDFQQRVDLICRYIKRETANRDELLGLLCQISCSTFSVADENEHIIGVALYILPSLFNHSCQPNCTYVFDGLKISVRTVQDVEPGQQLYISYVDLLDPREKRHETLVDGYCFTCRCQRCTSVPSKDSLLTSVLCTGCNKVRLTDDSEVHEASIFGVSICNCGEPPNSDLGRALIDEFYHLCNEMDSLQQGSQDQYTLCACNARYIAFHERASKVLSPYHYVSIRTQEKIMKLSLDLLLAISPAFDLDRCMDAGQSLIPSYNLFLGPCSKFTVHLLTLLIMSQGPGQEGNETHVDVEYIKTSLELTHGREHPLYKKTFM